MLRIIFVGGFFSLFIWAFAPVQANAQLAPEYKSEPCTDNTCRANVYWQLGKIDQAIALWQKEALLYRKQGKKQQEIEVLQKISLGYINLGKFRLAIVELNKIQDLAPSSPKFIATTQRRLGNAHRGIGDYSKALTFYKNSLKLETSLSTLNNLVNLLYEQSQNTLRRASLVRQDKDATKYKNLASAERHQAIKYARQALSLSQNENSTSTVRTLIEWNKISGKLTPQQIERGRAILFSLTPSEEVGYLMLNWAKIHQANQEFWLQRTLKFSRSLNNSYLKTHTLFDLGYFAHKQGDLKSALDYAKLAQLSAQSVFDYNGLFRAQRLAGRIYRQTNRKTLAIDSYRDAIASIDIVTRNINFTNKRQIINLSEEIEPIYRETLELLLGDSSTNSDVLNEALLIFEKIRLAQLSKYFGDDCFRVRKDRSYVSSKDKHAATISSIILENRTHFILQFDDGRLFHSKANLTKTELVKQADQWKEKLLNRATNEYRENSTLFYDLIIEPFEAKLEARNIEILVFIHDGILRNLPMSALYDREQFLAQKWASVSSIGLKFTSISPKIRNRKAIAFGLQGNIPGWNSLYNVASEIQNVRDLVGGKEFLNDEFTIDNLYRQLGKKEYSVLHFATHGYFGGTVETSFLLAYKEKISALKLEDILNKSKKIPSLLVLSACETALSSDRSLLGLGGIIARSGVESTLGTFWQVQDDEQSEMVEAFYRHWQNSKYNKATAIQQVQIEEIEKFVNAHPNKWAALNLIGDYR